MLSEIFFLTSLRKPPEQIIQYSVFPIATITIDNIPDIEVQYNSDSIHILEEFSTQSSNNNLINIIPILFGEREAFIEGFLVSSRLINRIFSLSSGFNAFSHFIILSSSFPIFYCILFTYVHICSAFLITISTSNNFRISNFQEKCKNT